MRRAVVALACFFACWLLSEELLRLLPPKGESFLRIFAASHLAGVGGFIVGLVLGARLDRMKEQPEGPGLLPVAAAAAVAAGFTLHFFSGGYAWEIREIRRLAGKIEGVRILEVRGNHDVTLEGIWLDIEVDGEPVCLRSVHARGFDHADSLLVARVGSWGFRVQGYDRTSAGKIGFHRFSGSCIDVGREGEFGFVSPPFENIPDLTERRDELRALVAGIPDEEPGMRVEEERYVVFYQRKPAE